MNTAYQLISLLRSEAILLLALVLLLLYKIFSEKPENKFGVILFNLALLAITVQGILLPAIGSGFGNMFMSSELISFEKSLLAFATLLISFQAHEWLKDNKNKMEFYILITSILMGMFFMISSGHFLMFYLGLELATLPLAALATFDFDKARSSEAGIKMILSSAFSSGILLFGLSLIYGTCGSLYFSEVGAAFDGSTLQMVALGFIISGFAFKISAVPFHLWTADVYEGSPVAVTSFLSVVSKGAAIFIFVSALNTVFSQVSEYWVTVISALAVVTMIIGNLFAMRQENIKRFLAFSSITQVGFLLIAVAAGSAQGQASIVYFILIYIFSNIGAFTVVSVIADKTGKEDISDYKGLYKTNPFLSIVLLLAVFSLAGIPPTAGFFGKLFLLTSGASKGLLVIVVIASLNMVLALYYYLRIAKAMFIDKNESPIQKLSIGLPAKTGMIICILGILVIGLISFIYHHISVLSFVIP